jgi:hypothetical protein
MKDFNEMKTIKCNECGKVLFQTETDNDIAAGVQAQDKGFIYKNACLFSDKYTSLFFCKKECYKSFYAREIQKDEAISNVLKEMRAEIPEMAKEIAGKIAKLQFNEK